MAISHHNEICVNKAPEGLHLAIKAFLTSVLLILCIASGAQSVLTQHNDNKRTGWEQGETTLTQANVSGGTFGKLYQYNVDDQVYSQPLIVNGVSIAGGTHNLLIIATVNNTVYAFDADDPTKVATPYWQNNLTFSPGTYRPPQNSDMANSSTDGACGGQGNYFDYTGKFGIVGTPVIDGINQVIYVVARSVSNVGGQAGDYRQYLHKLSLLTGLDMVAPMLISATVSGTGDGGSTVSFDPRKNNQRPALLLYNNIVYIAWASHCDWTPYHGWVIGYDAGTLAITTSIYNDTPDGGQGGIWMSGQGPAVDDLGNIYVSTGNGTVGSTGNQNDPRNRSESIVKLSSTNNLSVLDFFTPYNWSFLNGADQDYGVDGVLIIPNSNLSLSGSKEGYLFLTDNNNMGHTATAGVKGLQLLDVNAEYGGFDKHIHGSPVYFMDDKGKEYVYAWAEDGLLKQFPLLRTDPLNPRFDLPNTISGNNTLPFGMPGALMSVTSNGSVAGTGILWASRPLNGDAEHANVPGLLQAIDATDVTHELWNSNLKGIRDSVGTFAKFVPPTIANGKLYLATFSRTVKVYGLGAPTVTVCQAPITPLPSPWISGDIGYMQTPGDACYSTPNNGTYTLRASGNDIYGTADGFHSVFQPASGNTMVMIAHVVSFDINPNTKAGLMFRSNLDPGSPNILMGLNNFGSIVFSERPTLGGPSNNLTVTGSYTGPWIKLSASGNVFTAYTSPDGTNWTSVGPPVTLGLGTNIYGGLVYTPYNTGTPLATAVFDNVSVQFGSGTLPVTLVDFTAYNHNNLYGLLNWQTSAEIDFDHFVIERSTVNTDFASIGTVTGQGNGQGQGSQFYSFTDNSPADGMNFYRLKMVDKDGHFSYSKIVKVNFNLSIIQVYPNPAKGRVYLKNNSNFTQGQPMQIDLMDILGQHILTETIPTVNVDQITVNFPPFIKGGLYLLRVTNSKGQRQGWKIMVEE
jgi:hypothetical protein